MTARCCKKTKDSFIFIFCLWLLFFQVCIKYYYFFPYKIIIQLSPEVEVNSGNDRDVKRRGIYLAL